MPQKEAASSMKRPSETVRSQPTCRTRSWAFISAAVTGCAGSWSTVALLTLPQISQQDHLPIGKFQRIMMRSRVVLVDLPER